MEKNFKILSDSYKNAGKDNCDFFISTELALPGYPPKDLLLRNDFLKKVEFYTKKVIKLTKNYPTIFLLNVPTKQKKGIYNTALLIKSGKIIFQFNKSSLPNYGVFDEKRYFSSNLQQNNVFIYKEKKIKFLICEDLWDFDLKKKN